jgi:hypothetical protein
VRQGFLKARTAQANQIRGLAFGVVIPQRIAHLFVRLPEVLEDARNEVPESVRALMHRLLEYLKELERRQELGDEQARRCVSAHAADPRRTSSHIPGATEPEQGRLAP